MPGPAKRPFAVGDRVAVSPFSPGQRYVKRPGDIGNDRVGVVKEITESADSRGYKVRRIAVLWDGHSAVSLHAPQRLVFEHERASA